MNAITPRLFSKDVYSVPLRALRFRWCVRLDRGGGGGWLPKCFQMYKKFSGHIIIFPKIQLFSKFTFSSPENYPNSPENLLQIYLNLRKCHGKRKKFSYCYYKMAYCAYSCAYSRLLVKYLLNC